MLKRLHHLIQSHLGRGGAALLGGLALLHVGLCLLLFDPKLHTGGDSATYMLLAESIATAGDGYSLHVDPGPPVAHTKYPPGYPLALAPLVALFGRNLVVLKLLSVVFTAASVVVFGLMTRRAGWLPGGGEARPEGPVSGQGANGVRETGEGGAAGRSRRLLASPWFWLALAFAVSPGVIDYSRWMLSEAPFLLVTLFALWMMREDEAGPASRAVRAADGTGFRRKGRLLPFRAGDALLARARRVGGGLLRANDGGPPAGGPPRSATCGGATGAGSSCTERSASD